MWSNLSPAHHNYNQEAEVNEAVGLGWQLLLVQPGEFHSSFVLGWTGPETPPPGGPLVISNAGCDFMVIIRSRPQGHCSTILVFIFVSSAGHHRQCGQIRRLSRLNPSMCNGHRFPQIWHSSVSPRLQSCFDLASEPRHGADAWSASVNSHWSLISNKECRLFVGIIPSLSGNSQRPFLGRLRTGKRNPFHFRFYQAIQEF